MSGILPMRNLNGGPRIPCSSNRRISRLGFNQRTPYSHSRGHNAIVTRTVGHQLDVDVTAATMGSRLCRFHRVSCGKESKLNSRSSSNRQKHSLMLNGLANFIRKRNLQPLVIIVACRPQGSTTDQPDGTTIEQCASLVRGSGTTKCRNFPTPRTFTVHTAKTST